MCRPTPGPRGGAGEEPNEDYSRRGVASAAATDLTGFARP